MNMKFLTNSNGDAKRLFVPISEFEFNSFAVHVRCFEPRRSRVPQDGFRITQRLSNTLWVTSLIATASRDAVVKAAQ